MYGKNTSYVESSVDLLYTTHSCTKWHLLTSEQHGWSDEDNILTACGKLRVSRIKNKNTDPCDPGKVRDTKQVLF